MVVVDCLTLWISNLLLRGDGAAAVAAEVEAPPRCCRRRLHAVLVTNEVGMGVVPETPSGAPSATLPAAPTSGSPATPTASTPAALGCIVRLRPALHRVHPENTP